MTLIREAIEHVQRGIKLARDRDKPYLFLGRLYTTIGKLSAAEKMFTRAVQIRPDGLEAMRELRLLNMRREKGKGIFKRLLRR
jgi:tetratricopeptide (TPR) repeat protein